MTSLKARGKTYLIFALVFVITLGTVIFIVQDKTNRIVTELTYNQVQTANRALANYLKELEERGTRRSEVIAQNVNIITDLKSGNHERLIENLLNFALGIDIVSICDPHGITLVRSNSDKVAVDVSNQVNVAEVRQTGTKSSSVSVLPSSGTLVLNSSVPIYDGDSMIGIVNCVLELAQSEYLDTFKERTGTEATIFLGDERISTTIMDLSGKRIIGTKADDSVVETVIGQNNEFVGTLEIFGNMYGVYYSPLIIDGHVIGMLFTGIDIGSTLKSQRAMNYWIVLASFIGLVASMFLMFASFKIIWNWELLESELMDAKLAEQTSLAKSKFLSRMSHEMKTPMNAIIGMTEIARKTNDMTKIRYCLEQILYASKHLLGVFNDILDMMAIGTNSFRITYSELQVKALFSEVVSIAKFGVDEKKQNLTIEISDDIPPVIVSDKARLRQVMLNLLLNAVKFTPEGGEIALNASLENKRGNVYTILVEVADTGIGISKNGQQSLFVPFEQLDSGSTRKYGGIGIGLTICKQIVEQMGGKIWVDSEEGSGSKFSFTIVAKKGKKQYPFDPIESAGDTVSQTDKPRTILVADDVKINRIVVNEMLAHTGFNLEFAENGQQVVDMYIANPGKYCLILMDINMPKMDGYTATQRMRTLNIPEAANIPIIAMTANTLQEDIAKCLAIGMNDHIAKPVDANDMKTKIFRLIG